MMDYERSTGHSHGGNRAEKDLNLKNIGDTGQHQNLGYIGDTSQHQDYRTYTTGPSSTGSYPQRPSVGSTNRLIRDRSRNSWAGMKRRVLGAAILGTVVIIGLAIGLAVRFNTSADDSTENSTESMTIRHSTEPTGLMTSSSASSQMQATVASSTVTSSVDVTTSEVMPSGHQVFSVGHGFCHTFMGRFSNISFSTSHVSNLNFRGNTEYVSDVTDLFLMTFSVSLKKGLLSGDTLEARLRNAAWNVTLTSRRSDSLDLEDIDTSATTFIVGLRAGSPVWTEANYAIGDGQHPKDALSSWGGFRLSAVTSSDSIFAVETTKQSMPGIMTFERVNFPAGLDIFKDYVIPRDGTYVFSTVVQGEGACIIRLNIDGSPSVELSRDGDVSAGTLSRVTLLTLSRGQIVTLTLVSGVYSHAAFYGFFYNPPESAAIAWSVHRTSGLTINSSQTVNVTFDSVLANQGSVYDVNAGHLRIITPGRYYLHVNTGWEPGTPSLLYIVAGHAQYAVRRTSTNHGRDTIGRAIITELDTDDLVYIIMEGEQDSGGAIYSDQYLQTSFSGFLIQPL